MKTLLRLSTLLALLLCATALRAQTTNCAYPKGVQTGDNITYGPGAYYIASETITYQVTCYANGSSYYSASNSVTATGTVSYRNSPPPLACNPTFWTRIYTTTAMANSYFENFGQDGSIDNGLTKDTCYTSGIIHENDTVCGPVACPSSCPPVGSPPYGGGSVCYTWDTYSCSWQQTTCNSSPILVDVSGNGFALTNVAGGVKFDISGTGAPVQMAWTAPGANNAFLCLPDSSGACNSGKQLFGNFTPQPASPTPNGFVALAVYDGNGDGVIDARDAVFNSLRLWIDTNHNGVTDPGELYSLPSLGVMSISLSYKEDRRTDQYGNVFRYRAQVNPGGAPGTGRIAYDVFFVSVTNGTATTAKKCTVPAKAGMLSTTGSL